MYWNLFIFFILMCILTLVKWGIEDAIFQFLPKHWKLMKMERELGQYKN